jgi:hypothetical protein
MALIFTDYFSSILSNFLHHSSFYLSIVLVIGICLEHRDFEFRVSRFRALNLE